MPRKGHVPKREVMPDPIYQDKVITKLINNIMLDGKRGIAQDIVYDAFETIKKQTGEDALEVFYKALNNVMPVLEIKARRIGGATYQVLVMSTHNQYMGLGRSPSRMILERVRSLAGSGMGIADSSAWV